MKEKRLVDGFEEEPGMPETTVLSGVMPRPKSITCGEGQFTPPVVMALHLRGVRETATAVIDLKGAFRDSRGITLRERSRGKGPSLTLEVGGEAPRQGQGYRLRITPTGIVLSGRDGVGLFFGAQTLKQILEVSGRAPLPVATIDDWPDFPIRAAHLTLFRYQNQRPNLAFWEHLLTTVAPAAKLNAVILQTDWMLRCPRRPDMAQPFALTLPQMQRLAELGRKRHIAVIPHLQCLSHQYSLIGYSHPEWLTEPNGETYDPDAPGLRETLRDLMADMRLAFGDLPPGSAIGNGAPPLHIGLDEVGRLPQNQDANPAETFLRHLCDRDIDARRSGFSRIGFWPDMLPRYDSRGQGRNLLPRVPQGTLLFPWNYDDTPAFPLLEPLAAHSFPVWATGSAKYHRNNLARLARAARRHNCSALVGSCWNSWGPLTLDGVARPLSSLLLAGEFGWSSDAAAAPTTPPRSLPYDPVAKLRALTRGLSPLA